MVTRTDYLELVPIKHRGVNKTSSLRLTIRKWVGLSGQRESNPQPAAWKAAALPIGLCPHIQVAQVKIHISMDLLLDLLLATFYSYFIRLLKTGRAFLVSLGFQFLRT